ncbi:hypothetical protein AB205_0075850, partial [Aquarana catesbeiana]
IANLIQCNVRRGHTAAVYTSGLRSTSVGHKNKLFGVSHTGAPVNTWGVYMCETCPKKVSIPALVREKIMSSALNSAKQTIVPHFQAMFHIPISGLKYWCAKYTFCFILIGEKRIGTSEDTREPPPPEEGEQRSQPEDVEEGEVVEIVTITGDVQVVEEQSHHFTSYSAQRLIQNTMFCSRNLDFIKQKTNEIEQKLKNVIDVLGRI